jgi:hypothetical protein
MLTPIEKSILHWEDNLLCAKDGDINAVDTSDTSCALCMNSLHDDGSSMNCEVCPLHLANYGCIRNLDGERRYDGYLSPYNKVCELIETMYEDDCESTEPLVEAIEEMVTVLKGL